MANIMSIESNEIEALLETDYKQEDLDSLIKVRLVALLRIADISEGSDDDLLKLYHDALSVSAAGYRIVLKRDVDEIFVNNYNSEWLFNWNANMDIQFCFDYFAIITYISDYYGKDDSGTVDYIKQALNEISEDIRNKLRVVAQTFVTHRLSLEFCLICR